jgi:hypothetical protein
LLAPLKDVRCAHDCLTKLAELLCEHNNPADVARLIGAADALRERTGRPLTGGPLVSHDRAVAAVEQRLTPETFAAARAEGRAMSLDQAISYALEVEVPR